MSRKKQLIIPIFIPFAGCPAQCVFCDQKGITGQAKTPSLPEVSKTIEEHLSTWRSPGEKEIAFYGGSFTGLPGEVQEGYLGAAFSYVEAGRVDAIRISTRPDYISEEIITVLKRFGVKTVELGAQSMSDEVLKLSGRGHGSNETRAASALIKSAGMRLGVQFMPGLPGDTEEAVLYTAKEVLALGPEFARVYPALVLNGTPLHRMYLAGLYAPWGLDEMVAVCKKISGLFKEAGVKIIRMGLHPTEELERNLVCGPFHRSFRQLVDGRA